MITNKNKNTIKNKINKVFFFFFITFQNKKRFNDFFFYQQFNLLYLQNIYKLNLKEKNLNALNILPSKLSKYILFKTQNTHFKAFNIKYFNEIIYMFLINIWLKNPKNICKYIKKKLDNIHFKKHKSYFLFFSRILNKYIQPNFKILQTKGITLKFKGKLGKGGNSRKKTIYIRKNYYSLSNKLLALNQNKWNVWTKTGTVGCSFQIFYKYMTFFFNLYIYFYIITLLSVWYLIKVTFLNKITLQSFPHIIYYFISFSKFKSQYYSLIISLTGVPPFIFFFFKLNILISFLSKCYMDIFFCIFIVLYLNMIFYLQTFFIKNFKFNPKLIKTNKKYISWNIFFFINYIIMIFYFQLLIYTDLHFFLSLIMFS